jgi:hypothetical protein
VSFGDSEAQVLALYSEGPEAEAGGVQRSLAVRVAGSEARLLATGGLEAGIRVALGDVLGADAGQRPQVGAGELSTQGGEGEHRRAKAAEPDLVELDQRCPDITRCPQDLEASSSLASSGAQGHPGRAYHRLALAHIAHRRKGV